jgi:hypothetical protein
MTGKLLRVVSATFPVRRARKSDYDAWVALEMEKVPDQFKEESRAYIAGLYTDWQLPQVSALVIDEAVQLPRFSGHVSHTAASTSSS